MTRSTIIFGNGLGMALDADYFRLSAGLKSAWAESDNFTSEFKQLLASAIPGVTEEVYPESETQLDQLQMAIVASDFLRSFETGEVKWLADASRKLPQAFRSFIYEAAAYFHESRMEIPRSFTEKFTEFIEDSRCHVAVLNYDNLLYDALINAGILRGFNGPLIDGYTRQGFHPSNLYRHNDSKTGWYMHLHGSPLFLGNKKLMREEREQLNSTSRSHIVLTHVKHKPSIIDSSHILREYWKCLDKALDESDKVILFGYSGCDIHLNYRIIVSAALAKKPIHIVEWTGQHGIEERERFWNTQLLDCDVTVHWLDNILDFTNWNSS